MKEARLPHWLSWLFIIAASLGFLDATYLSVQHALSAGGPLNVVCIVGAPGTCNIVLQSIYAKIIGIPVAYFGMLYYATVLVLAVRLYRMRDSRAWHLLQIVTSVGFAFSLYFVYLQLVVLRNICMYCMISASLSTIMFASAMWHRLKK